MGWGKGASKRAVRKVEVSSGTPWLGIRLLTKNPKGEGLTIAADHSGGREWTGFAGMLAVGVCCPQAGTVQQERDRLRSCPRTSPVGARRVLGLGEAIINSWPSLRDPQMRPHDDCPRQGKRMRLAHQITASAGVAAPHMPTAAPLQAFQPLGSPGSCSSAVQALSALTMAQPSWKLLEKAPASYSE